MKRAVCLVSVIVLLAAGNSVLLSQESKPSIFSAGLYAGIGLPKVSYSVYRPPFSLTAGLHVFLKTSGRTAVRACVNYLYTIDLGTITDDEYDLAFTAAWVSAEAMYMLRGRMFDQSFVSLGVAKYSLMRDLQGTKSETAPAGVNLGLFQINHRGKWNSTVDVRWHLLFNPDSNSQMLTITFGWAL